MKYLFEDHCSRCSSFRKNSVNNSGFCHLGANFSTVTHADRISSQFSWPVSQLIKLRGFQTRDRFSLILPLPQSFNWFVKFWNFPLVLLPETREVFLRDRQPSWAGQSCDCFACDSTLDFHSFQRPKNCIDHLLRFSTQFSVGKLSLFAKQGDFLMVAGCIIGYKYPFLQPMAFRYYLLQHYLPAVLLSARKRVSGTKCHSGNWHKNPGGLIYQFQIPSGPKPFVLWSPVTQSLKERFRFSSIYWTSGTNPIRSDFGFPDAQTRRSEWTGIGFN
jgi:hypothetical protein